MRAQARRRASGTADGQGCSHDLGANLHRRWPDGLLPISAEVLPIGDRAAGRLRAPRLLPAGVVCGSGDSAHFPQGPTHIVEGLKVRYRRLARRAWIDPTWSPLPEPRDEDSSTWVGIVLLNAVSCRFEPDLQRGMEANVEVLGAKAKGTSEHVRAPASTSATGSTV